MRELVFGAARAGGGNLGTLRAITRHHGVKQHLLVELAGEIGLVLICLFLAVLEQAVDKLRALTALFFMGALGSDISDGSRSFLLTVAVHTGLVSELLMPLLRDLVGVLNCIAAWVAILAGSNLTANLLKRLMSGLNRAFVVLCALRSGFAALGVPRARPRLLVHSAARLTSILRKQIRAIHLSLRDCAHSRSSLAGRCSERTVSVGETRPGPSFLRESFLLVFLL